MWPNRAALLLAMALPGMAGAVECTADSVVIGTASADVRISVEIADDAAERARGLMFRRQLDPDAGMLFIYESPQPVSFWMRNTLIPLDLIFIDMQGVIRHIHRNARPLDETPIPGAAVGDPSPDRLMVLEIGGGEADRHGLAVGQALAHPALGGDATFACD